jgi:hypothetical protein
VLKLSRDGSGEDCDRQRAAVFRGGEDEQGQSRMDHGVGSWPRIRPCPISLSRQQIDDIIAYLSTLPVQ